MSAQSTSSYSYTQYYNLHVTSSPINSTKLCSETAAKFALPVSQLESADCLDTHFPIKIVNTHAFQRVLMRCRHKVAAKLVSTSRRCDNDDEGDERCLAVLVELAVPLQCIHQRLLLHVIRRSDGSRLGGWW